MKNLLFLLPFIALNNSLPINSILNSNPELFNNSLPQSIEPSNPLINNNNNNNNDNKSLSTHSEFNSNTNHPDLKLITSLFQNHKVRTSDEAMKIYPNPNLIYRILKPNAIITLEFLPNRLNLVVDDNYNFVRAYFG